MRLIRLVLSLAAFGAAPLAAQTPFLVMIGAGVSPRIGPIPPRYPVRGLNTALQLWGSRRVHPFLLLTAGVDMTLQPFDITDTAGTYAGTFAFHTYAFGVGPVFVRAWESGISLLTTVKPAMVVSFWGPPEAGPCTQACTPTFIPEIDKQRETRFGALVGATLAVQVIGRGQDDPPLSFAVEGRCLAAPRHAASGLPVRQCGAFFLIVAGEP